LVEKVAFEFYHHKPDQHGEVRLTRDMVARDPLLLGSSAKAGKRDLADFGAFVRGCVQIAEK